MLIHREDLKAPKRVDNEEETITHMFIKELKTATNEDLDADELAVTTCWCGGWMI